MLQATALVHEAYIRLVDVENGGHWDSRAHFFGVAAEAMRRIPVENARRHASLKRGAKAEHLGLDERTLVCAERTFDLLALDEALRKLDEHDPEAGRHRESLDVHPLGWGQLNLGLPSDCRRQKQDESNQRIGLGLCDRLAPKNAMAEAGREF